MITTKINLSSEIASISEQLGLRKENPAFSTGLKWAKLEGTKSFASHSPINNQLLAFAEEISGEDYTNVINQAKDAFEQWRLLPAPQRGEIVRQYGLALRKYKEPIGKTGEP